MRHFVFQVRNVFNMTAKEGRKKSVRVLVAVGNGNGAAGEWLVVGWVWPGLVLKSPMLLA